MPHLKNGIPLKYPSHDFFTNVVSSNIHSLFHFYSSQENNQFYSSFCNLIVYKASLLSQCLVLFLFQIHYIILTSTLLLDLFLLLFLQAVQLHHLHLSPHLQVLRVDTMLILFLRSYHLLRLHTIHLYILVHTMSLLLCVWTKSNPEKKKKKKKERKKKNVKSLGEALIGRTWRHIIYVRELGLTRLATRIIESSPSGEWLTLSW